MEEAHRTDAWRPLPDFELAGREIEDIIGYLHSLARAMRTPFTGAAPEAMRTLVAGAAAVEAP
jgi:hypothetical protein